VVWVLVVSLLNRGLRVALRGYVAAELQMTFSLGMMAARLVLAALASLSAGAAARAVAPSRRGVSWVLGAFLLVAFIPVHVRLWPKFPLWYHLVFLGSLVPFVVLGAMFARNRSRMESSAQGRSA
jgi:hypothetical protein